MSEENNRSRRHKGYSLITFPDDFFVVDIETTGLDPKFNEIIEIAVVKVIDSKAVDTFSTLIKPYYPVSDFITSLTGITNEMLDEAPEIEQVLPELLDYIGNGLVLGYNINFDINFIYDAALALTGVVFSNNFVDVMRIARKILPDLDRHRLVDLVDHYEIEENNAHRALSDCFATLECFKALQEDILNQYPSLEAFADRHGSVFFQKNVDINSLHITNTEFNTEHPLYEKFCVFTGTLEKLGRKEAMLKVLEFGGQCSNTLNHKTNYLILGNNDYSGLIKGGKSNKQRYAEELRLKGFDIEIISENVFYDMIGDDT